MRTNRLIFPVAIGVACWALSCNIGNAGIEYSLANLGKLNGTISYGNSINAKGHVAGIGEDQFNNQHAVFHDGSLHDLGALFPGEVSYAYSINDQDHVVGSHGINGSGTSRAFLYDGAMHDIGTLGGVSAGANDINSTGQVTGFAFTAGSPQQLSHAFLWTPTSANGTIGVMVDLGTLGGSSSTGFAINASGQVTGISDTSGGGLQHAFLWKPTTPGANTGTMYDLGKPGEYSNATGINAVGQITGTYYSSTSGGNRGYVWTPTTPNGTTGTMVDLGTLGGTYVSGNAINSAGQIIGTSGIVGDSDNHAFLYTAARGIVDLNLLIDPMSGWQLNEAIGINELGQITGYGTFNNARQIFVLSPVPEPSGLALIAFAAVTILVSSQLPRQRTIN
jgi:probable HAF family extracellular repeat protein